MNKEATYNGWTNKDTWLVNLNLSNSQLGDVLFQSCKTSEEVKKIWELCGDLLWDKVDEGKVNWDELIESIRG